jgi:hypothetical protein
MKDHAKLFPDLLAMVVRPAISALPHWNNVQREMFSPQ